MPQRPLGRVVGGRDVRDAGERPERGLVVEASLAEPPGLRVAASGAFGQQIMDLLAVRRDVISERFEIRRVAARCVQRGEHAPELVGKRPTEPARSAVAFAHPPLFVAWAVAASPGGSPPGFRRALPAAATLLGAETSTQATLHRGPGSPEPFSGDRQRRKLELLPEWMPDPETTPPTLTAIRSRLTNTYTGYSIGCLAVWAALLATGRGLLDAKNWGMLRLGAVGSWAGWLSATIARVATRRHGS